MLIHNQPDADTIFGNWYRMLTLAAKDPEGYVRPSPDYPMNAQTFAQYFNRPLQTVEKTIDLLEKMNLVTVRDGFIKVNAPGKITRHKISKTKPYIKKRIRSKTNSA